MKSLLAAMSVAGFAVFASQSAFAGEVNVLNIQIFEQGGSYTFRVTVEHADEGWDHYADKWEVLAPDGSVLGERVLQHPHVNEQPFTRVLTKVSIPEDVDKVTVRAHDSVHEWGGVEMTVDVPR